MYFFTVFSNYNKDLLLMEKSFFAFCAREYLVQKIIPIKRIMLAL